MIVDTLLHSEWRGLVNVPTTAGHWGRTGNVVLCVHGNGALILVVYNTVNSEDLLTTPHQATGGGLAMRCFVSWVKVSCVLLHIRL